MLWVPDKAEHHGGRAGWRKAAHLVVVRKQREEGAAGKMHLSRAHASDPLLQPHLTCPQLIIG